MPLDTCEELTCPHCGNDDERQIDLLVWIPVKGFSRYFCNLCAKEFTRLGDKYESNNQSSQLPPTGDKTG